MPSFPEPNMIRMRTLPAALALLLGLAAPLWAQVPIEVPEDLQLFWKQYQPAHEADDEAAMDKAVRQHLDLAEQTLDLLLDDLSRKDVPELHDEVRALGRSMDRVQGQPISMHRVRYVLNLSQPERVARRAAVIEFNKAFAVFNDALTEKSEDGWTRSLEAFRKAADTLETVGDVQFAIDALRKMADLERLLNRPWESGQHLKRIVELGKQLDYEDVEVDSARTMLAEMKAKGIDPDAPKPEGAGAPAESGATGEAAPTGGGLGLTSFKEGSVEASFPLALDAPKKGLGSIQLPSFFPLDNYLLWLDSWMDNNGPSALDLGTPTPFVPFDKPLMVSRDGAEFSIDADGDGKADVTFTPNTTPQRIEIPAPDGSGSYPLMVSVPGDKEAMFGLELNFSPQPIGARLRVQIASSMDGKVLDETWKVMDSNLSGRFGDVQDWWGDLVTTGVEANPIRFQQTDAVLIGKAKAAIPWSSVLPLGEDFYRATLTPDGKTLSLRQLDLATGFVKLEIDTPVAPTHVVLREVGRLEGAFLNVVPAKKGGVVKVPAGTWQLAFGRIEKGAKTSMQQARIYTGQSAPIEVKAGETTTLSLGGPFKLSASTKLDGKATVVEGTSLRIFGRAQEEYAMLFDDSLQPDVETRTADGKKFGKPAKMRRPDIAVWQEANAPDVIVWFPHMLSIESGKPEKLQVRLTQKSQSLLGGPFDSDWIP
jgi:hypothetical protein